MSFALPTPKQSSRSSFTFRLAVVSESSTDYSEKSSKTFFVQPNLSYSTQAKPLIQPKFRGTTGKIILVVEIRQVSKLLTRWPCANFRVADQPPTTRPRERPKVNFRPRPFDWTVHEEALAGNLRRGTLHCNRGCACIFTLSYVLGARGRAPRLLDYAAISYRFLTAGSVRAVDFALGLSMDRESKTGRRHYRIIVAGESPANRK